MPCTLAIMFVSSKLVEDTNRLIFHMFDQFSFAVYRYYMLTLICSAYDYWHCEVWYDGECHFCGQIAYAYVQIE